MLTSEQQTILGQVLRLVDISGDLDRNKSDGDFLEGGGTILNVVDENIFEMFVQPAHHREAVETFYADIWEPLAQLRKGWHAFEAQAGLITAEFIISGAGGKGDSEILMTDHHRWELAHRIGVLTSEIRSRIEAQPNLVQSNMALKLAIGSDLEHGRLAKAENYLSKFHLNILKEDLASISDAPEAVKDRFQIARVSAEFLANERIIEPLHQLRRIASYSVESRIGSIQTRFKISNNREAVLIEAEAERWFERLAEELKRPGHRHRLRAQREIKIGLPDAVDRESIARALRNDARSIAFVQWVSRTKLDPSKRLIFVTGDAVLFDAYRRWHIKENEAGRGPEPFVMRRATQFTPIFNPTDSGGDLAPPIGGPSQKLILFTLIQQAVEAALLPLPVTLKPPSKALTGLNLPREKLALKLVDQETLAADPDLSKLAELLTSPWMQQRSREIKNIRESWQKAQRFSIGASTALITPRLGKDLQDAAARYFAETSSGVSPFLAEYVTNVLDKLVDDSIQVWVPLAESFDQGSFDFVPRIGSKKRFEVALGDLLRGTSPKAVFTRASCRGLEMQDISNANRFAILALRADRLENVRAGLGDQPDLDLLYLNAVTYRFLISTVDSHLKRSRMESRRNALVFKGVDQVKVYHGQAENLIERCLALHAAEAEERVDPGPRRTAHIRFLRALSERASLNLFMATSLGLAGRINPHVLLRDFSGYLTIARGDLWRCIGNDEYDEEDNDPVLGAVRAQYVPNLAAYDVLASILAQGAEFKLQTWPRSSRHLIRRLWTRGQNIHPLLEAELRAYFALVGEEIGARAVGRVRPQDQRQLRLALDRELYRAILRESRL